MRNFHSTIPSFEPLHSSPAAIISTRICANKLLPRSVGESIRNSLGRKHHEISDKTLASVLDGLTSNIRLRGLLSYLWGDHGLPPGATSFATHSMVSQTGAILRRCLTHPHEHAYDHTTGNKNACFWISFFVTLITLLTSQSISKSFLVPHSGGNSLPRWCSIPRWGLW